MNEHNNKREKTQEFPSDTQCLNDGCKKMMSRSRKTKKRGKIKEINRK